MRFSQQQVHAPHAPSPVQDQEVTWPPLQAPRIEKPLWMVILILSSFSFFLTLASIVFLAIVLVQDNNYSDFSWWEPRVTETTLGLISSIGVMLLCGAMFVLVGVALSKRLRK